MPATDADIAKLSFEDALKELEQIVDKLEKGAIELEEFDCNLRARRGFEDTLQ